MAAFAMAKEAKDCIYLALDVLHGYNETAAMELQQKEELLDVYEDRLGTYLVKLSGKDLSKSDSKTLSILLHCTSDLERISDHALHILESAEVMREKKQEFSRKA